MERKGDHGREFDVLQLIITSDIHEQMIQFLEAALPYESGGLLFGRRLKKEWIIEDFQPIASDNPDVRNYNASPRVLVPIIMKAKVSGKELLATVHSHPSCPAVPSRKDLKEAHGYRDLAHCIVSFAGMMPDVQFYRYEKVEHHVSFHPLTLKLTNW